MKYLFLLASFFTLTTSNFAQSMAQDRYTVSGGLLGALNYNKLKVTGDNAQDFDSNHKLGWSLGAWLNLPLGHALSIEPQVMYSLYTYESDGVSLITSGNVSYISIPVLVKLHLHRYFALSVGPQMDFLGKLNHISPNDLTKDFLESSSFSLSVGAELFSHEPLVLYGRYILGLSAINKELPGNLEFTNANLQMGFKLRLFGKVIPADTDADGIPDVDDKCPTVFGLAGFEGCPDTDSDGITDAMDDCPLVAGILKYKGCPIPDTDNDGVNDEVDKCITVAGFARYNGCPIPDSDGDGVNDEVDKCITVAGLERYAGCPIPDTDGDGFNDEVDKCPTVAGLARFDGCPDTDRDNDGVLNSVDLCPDTPGPATNEGCPVVESATFNGRMINFVSGSAKLTSNSKAALKEAAHIMLSDPFNNLLFHIHGHTDWVGSDEYNLKLSRDRAASVRAELIKNGVPAARMTSEGYGESRPIATNETADGRALNRRTEILARHNQEVNEPVTVPKQ